MDTDAYFKFFVVFNSLCFLAMLVTYIRVVLRITKRLEEDLRELNEQKKEKPVDKTSRYWQLTHGGWYIK